MAEVLNLRMVIYGKISGKFQHLVIWIGKF